MTNNHKRHKFNSAEQRSSSYSSVEVKVKKEGILVEVFKVGMVQGPLSRDPLVGV